MDNYQQKCVTPCSRPNLPATSISGITNHKVHKTNLHVLEELKQNIRQEISSISQLELRRLMDNFLKRCQKCMDNDGGICYGYIDVKHHIITEASCSTLLELRSSEYLRWCTLCQIVVFQESLEVLSMDAFVDHVMKLLRRDDEGATCDLIKTLLSQNIPPCFANKITRGFLIETYHHICSNGGCITKELVASLIHPKVTHISLNFSHLEHLVYNGKRLSIASFFWKDVIPRLSQLKSLKVRGYGNWYREAAFPPQLESVSLTCDDETLALLADQCPLLRHVNLNSAHITERSIATLHRIQHLEELDIARTGIHSLHFVDLISGLPSCLRKFSCSDIRASDINLLISLHRFPDLQCLSVTRLECDCALDSGLGPLSELRVEYSCNSRYVRSLLNIGCHLVTLELYGWDLDLLLLARYCPKLQNLQLTSCRDITLHYQDPAPEFLTLRKLHVQDCTFHEWCMLTASYHLETLTLLENSWFISHSLTAVGYTSCLQNLLKKNSLVKLREFNSDSMVSTFLQHCPNLRVVRTSTAPLLQDKYPNVKFIEMQK